MKGETLPQSALGMAVAYTLNRWPKLVRQTLIMYLYLPTRAGLLRAVRHEIRPILFDDSRWTRFAYRTPKDGRANVDRRMVLPPR